MRSQEANHGITIRRLFAPFVIRLVSLLKSITCRHAARAAAASGKRTKGEENKFSDSPRFDRVKLATLCYQRLTAVGFTAVLALSVTLGHAQAQSGPESAERPAATAPESATQAQAKAQTGPQGEPAPNPSPVVGDALTDYLRALAQAQAARADALQAQGDVMRAQQALAQAVERARQAQAVLSAVVSARAKESGAAEGMRLQLDGTWIPPAESAPPAQ